jgi:uncharacterized pyridoxal phosphate-dependent enzyme
VTPCTSTRTTNPVPTYKSLGVRPIINAGGTYTFMSGSRLLDVSAQAMVEASNGYVEIDELMEAVGRRLAELTGAEWGYITNCCTSAINQVAAACIAGTDPEKIARLPDTAGMPDEVITLRKTRTGFDHAIRMAGGRMIPVDNEADMRAAMNERTAMVFIVGDSEANATIPTDRMIAIAHEYGVPCLVDAAAQRPDVPNRYLAMGADVVCYSGGKCLRGPQSSGLVLGRKDLVLAAYMNAAPHGGEGRTMKVGKEEIMALLAAVEAWLLGRDHVAEWRMWEGYLATIREAVEGLPSVQTEIEHPGIANVTPYLRITWDPQVLHVTPAELHGELLSGEPRILINLREDGLLVNPYMLEDGEAAIVARRLVELMSNRPAREPAPAPAAPAVDVSGAWTIHLRFTRGESRHSMTLEQDGARVSGTYRSQYGWGQIEGSVAGNKVDLRVSIPYEASGTSYHYVGTVEGDTLSGTMPMGRMWQAEWVARRV